MENFTDLIINLHPGAKENLISGWMENGSLKIKIREKPIAGKANRSLLKFLSKSLGMKRSEIEIISGMKSRKKKIRFWGVEESVLTLEFNKLIDYEP